MIGLAKQCRIAVDLILCDCIAQMVSQLLFFCEFECTNNF